MGYTPSGELPLFVIGFSIGFKWMNTVFICKYPYICWFYSKVLVGHWLVTTSLGAEFMGSSPGYHHVSSHMVRCGTHPLGIFFGEWVKRSMHG